MKKKIYFLIVIGQLIFTQTNAQLPDFLERLNGGTVQSGDFYKEIPFEFADNRIYINSLINNHPFRLLVDTHSPCLLYDYIIDQAKLDTLDKSALLGKAFENTFMMPVYPKIESFTVGHVQFSSIGAMIMKKDKSNPMKDMKIDGILGANLMRHCIWQFNFVDTVIILTNDISRCKNIKDAIQIPFTPKPIQASPNIKMVIGNDIVNAQFDTGNNGFINALSPNISQKIDDNEAVGWTMKLEIPVDRNDLDSLETHYYVLLDSLLMGKSMLYNVPVVSYNPDYKKLMGQGSLGIDFLKHFITTIDWNENIIFLFPNNSIDELPHNKSTFGFTYEYRKNKFRIKSIFSGSKAEQIGIKIGDEILAINGVSLTQLSQQSVENYRDGKLKFSSDEDSEISITLLKDGANKKFVFNRYYLFTNK